MEIIKKFKIKKLDNQKTLQQRPTTMPFTHHHTGIRQWERNECILTSKSGVNSSEKKKQRTNKSDGGAHWRTEACKLFRSSFLRFRSSFTINCVL